MAFAEARKHSWLSKKRLVYLEGQTEAGRGTVPYSSGFKICQQKIRKKGGVLEVGGKTLMLESGVGWSGAYELAGGAVTKPRGCVSSRSLEAGRPVRVSQGWFLLRPLS